MGDRGKSPNRVVGRCLAVRHGIPSHDTFGRVFSLVEAEAFTACLLGWIESVFRVSEGQVIAMDGKPARRSHQQPSLDGFVLLSAVALAPRHRRRLLKLPMREALRLRASHIRSGTPQQARQYGVSVGYPLTAPNVNPAIKRSRKKL